MPRIRVRIEERFCYRGDTVRLKTGGPEMLVVGWERELVICEWVDREVAVIRDEYHPGELKFVRKA